MQRNPNQPRETLNVLSLGEGHGRSNNNPVRLTESPIVELNAHTHALYCFMIDICYVICYNCVFIYLFLYVWLYNFVCVCECLNAQLYVVLEGTRSKLSEGAVEHTIFAPETGGRVCT